MPVVRRPIESLKIVRIESRVSALDASPAIRPEAKPARRGAALPSRAHLVLVLILVLALLGHLHFANVTIDDAFISFRYAENLVHGRGLVFNVGERVEGYSNFLWTVLLAVPIALKVDRFELGLLATAKVVGVLFSLATLGLTSLTARLGRSSADGHSAPLSALYLATLAPFLFWGVGALETPLVTCLLMLAFSLHLREDLAISRGAPSVPFSYPVLLLAALTRPEPLILFAPLAALRLWRVLRAGGLRRTFRREVGYLLLFAVPYAALVAGRFGYYGQLVPNTYFAKVHGDPHTTERGARYLASALSRLNIGPLLLFGGACVLLGQRLPYRAYAALSWCAVYLSAIGFEGGDWMPAARMLVPVLPLIALLVHELWLMAGALSPPPWVAKVGGALRLIDLDTLSRPIGLRLLRGTARAVLLLLLATGSYANFRAVMLPERLSGFYGLRLDHSRHFTIARWISRELREPGLLALGEAGLIPYYTKRPVLDLLGLMDAHLARLPGEMHRKFDANYVLARRPRFVLLFVTRDRDGSLRSDQLYAEVLLADARFLRDYSPMHDFGHAILYARRTVAPEAG